MGLVKATIQLTNHADVTLHESGYIDEANIRSMSILALVDSGSVMLAINQTIKTQLGLKVRDRRTAQLADGSILELDVVGPIEVKYKERFSITNAMVLPGNEEVLLGAIPMEEMDLLIHPANQELIINPQHPLKPQMTLK